MDQPAPRAKRAETFIHPSAKLREVVLGARCEVLERSAVEYSTIGTFCAIAAHVRIGPPNHPMERASQHRFT